jgi:hypothetical protein
MQAEMYVHVVRKLPNSRNEEVVGKEAIAQTTSTNSLSHICFNSFFFHLYDTNNDC